MTAVPVSNSPMRDKRLHHAERAWLWAATLAVLVLLFAQVLVEGRV